MTQRLGLVLASWLTVVAVAPLLSAAPISITNASFESQVPDHADPNDPSPNYTLGAGEFSGLSGASFGAKVSVNPAPGWTAIGGGNPYVGQQNVPIGTNSMIQSPPDGANIAYMDGGNSLRQVLGDDLIADTIYTLSVYLGLRGDGNNTPQWRIELLAGGNLLEGQTFPTNTVGTAGTYQLVSIDYTSPSVVTSGQSLEVRLSNVGNPTAQFDLVSLDAIPVPEPHTLTLIALGGMGFIAACRRRRR